MFCFNLFFILRGVVFSFMRNLFRSFGVKISSRIKYVWCQVLRDNLLIIGLFFIDELVLLRKQKAIEFQSKMGSNPFPSEATLSKLKIESPFTISPIPGNVLWSYYVLGYLN